MLVPPVWTELRSENRSRAPLRSPRPPLRRLLPRRPRPTANEVPDAGPSKWRRRWARHRTVARHRARRVGPKRGDPTLPGRERRDPVSHAMQRAPARAEGPAPNRFRWPIGTEEPEAKAWGARRGTEVTSWPDPHARAGRKTSARRRVPTGGPPTHSGAATPAQRSQRRRASLPLNSPVVSGALVSARSPNPVAAHSHGDPRGTHART